MSSLVVLSEYRPMHYRAVARVLAPRIVKAQEEDPDDPDARAWACDVELKDLPDDLRKQFEAFPSRNGIVSFDWTEISAWRDSSCAEGALRVNIDGRNYSIAKDEMVAAKEERQERQERFARQVIDTGRGGKQVFHVRA
tara:strand:+ start:143 stop:559 length:417 start_codon:yes stop_codon:yes gene_type:complete